MVNRKINIKTIIIVVLIVIIISMFFVILNMKNNNIVGQEIKKEQLGETNNSNAYVDMETHLSEVNEKQQELNNMQNLSGQATATAGQILKNYTAYKDGKLITGTMANNEAITKTLNAGESYTIPTGYHNGSGKVTANSLESQTSATATAADITTGKTAYVNGNKITGTASGCRNKQVIGSTNSLSSISFDVKSILPNNYSNLTIDNFGITDVIAQWKSGKAHQQNYIFDSYDASTGTLYCNASCSYGGDFTIYFDYTVVCFY